MSTTADPNYLDENIERCCVHYQSTTLVNETINVARNEIMMLTPGNIVLADDVGPFKISVSLLGLDGESDGDI